MKEEYLESAEKFAARVWEAVSIAAFLGGDKDEKWLRQTVKEFEKEVRKDERRRIKNGSV